MLKEEKFKAIQLIREEICYLDTMLECFPKKDLEISRAIKEQSYEMLKLSYYANVTSDLKLRQANLEQIIVNIKLLDFFVNLCYDKKIITQKKYFRIGQKLDEITKYVIGWLNTTIKMLENNNGA